MTKIFWIGFPGPCGGANTECYHTVKLLRDNGVDITILPTEGADVSYWEKLTAIGCKINPDFEAYKEPSRVSGVRDSIVVSMCNSFFSAWSHKYRDIGCRVIWINCMTFMFQGERKQLQRFGPHAAYVFQSEWQRERLEIELLPYGYQRSTHGYLIRGPFDIGEFPFRPKANDEPFVIGRLSRAEVDKYSRDTWRIFTRVKDALPDRTVRGRSMAWHPKLMGTVGRPPDFIECLKSCAETSQDFLASLHCLIQRNGMAGENWPRVGLEAMAAGVPIVAENRWGWREMIEDGEGCLCDTPEDQADRAVELALDESKRQSIISAARAKVAKLSDPGPIWAGWKRMLEGLGA